MIAIYVRVSTEEQLKGYSVEGQIHDCIKRADTHNVLKYVDEGYTGEIMNRPELEKLLKDVEEGLIEKLICYDPDRLSRKLLNQLLITEKLEKHDVELEFIKSDYKSDAEGQLYFQVRGAFSEFDKAKIKHNTMTGRYRKAKQGFVVKNNGLYGYDYDYENKTYVINEDHAEVVQMIFNYFTDPNTIFKGINGIAHHLTDIGVPTARGGKVWHRQVVRQILMNESYTGRYYQNKYDTEGNYIKRQAGEKFKSGRLRNREEWLETEIPQIISPKQFEYTQELLKQVRRRYAGLKRFDYLLSGLVRCGRCGETMTGRKRKSHGKDFYVYECRKNYAGARSRGCGRMMSDNKLTKYVWSSLVDLLNDPEKIKEYKEESQKVNMNNEIEYLDKQIQKVRKGRKRLLALLSMSQDEDIDIKEIKGRLKELQQQEKKILAKLDKQNQKFLIYQESNKTSSTLERAIQYLLIEKEKTLCKEDKQQMLRMLLKEVEVINSNTIHVHVM